MPPDNFSDGEHGQLWDELEAVRADVLQVHKELTALTLTVAVHLAEVARDRESFGPALKKLDGLWDWRNKVLGGMAFLGLLVSINGVGVWVLHK